jgi:hypothetical protein
LPGCSSASAASEKTAMSKTAMPLRKAIIVGVSLSIGPRSAGPVGDDRPPKRPKDGYARALW